MRPLWKPEKNEWLKKERGLSFEDIEDAIAAGHLLDVLENKNHRNQVILVVMLRKNVIAVAATIRGDIIFFRTAYISRSLAKKYRRKK